MITPYYIHTDCQGSYNVITNSKGEVVERLNFDPWGRRRHPIDWTYSNVPTTFLFDRGYTGHEHLDRFGLINMNGRVYEPRLARFLSPDLFLQDLGNSQSHNRYRIVTEYRRMNIICKSGIYGNAKMILKAGII